MNDGAIDIVFILVSKPSTALVLALGSLSSRTMVANVVIEILLLTMLVEVIIKR